MFFSGETADSDIAAKAAREFFARPQTPLVREEESRQVKNEKNTVTPLFSSEQINSGAVSIVDLGNGQLMLADGSDRQQVLTRHQFLQVYADADQALKLYASALEPSASQKTSVASSAQTETTPSDTKIETSAVSTDVEVEEDEESTEVIEFNGVKFDLAHFSIQIDEVFHDHSYDLIFKLSDGNVQLTLDNNSFDRFDQEYSNIGIDQVDTAIRQAWEAYEPSERARQVQKEDEESLVTLQLGEHYYHFQLNRLGIYKGTGYYYAYSPLGGYKFSQEQIDQLCKDSRFQVAFDQALLSEPKLPFDTTQLKITQKAPNYFNLDDGNYRLDVTRSQLERLRDHDNDLAKIIDHEFNMEIIGQHLDRVIHPEKHLDETIGNLFNPSEDEKKVLANEVPSFYLEEYHVYSFDNLESARKIDFVGKVSERLKTLDPEQVRERFADDDFFQLVVCEKGASFAFDQDALEKNFYRLPPSQAVHFYGDSDFFRFCVQGNSDYGFFLAGLNQFKTEMPARNEVTKHRLQEIAEKLQLKNINEIPPEKRDEETLRAAVLTSDYAYKHIEYDYDFLLKKLSTVPIKYQFTYELYLGTVKGIGICTTYSYVVWQLLKSYGYDAILLGGTHEDPQTKHVSGHAFVGVRYQGKYYIFDPTNNHLGVSDANYQNLYKLVSHDAIGNSRDAYTILMTGKDAEVASGEDIPNELINKFFSVDETQ